jgi:hypothetical protein
VRSRQALFNRCSYRNRFGRTYTTYETDRTNESAAKIARDGVADREAPEISEVVCQGTSLEIVVVLVVELG